jgi:hypothetical protein
VGLFCCEFGLQGVCLDWAGGLRVLDGLRLVLGDCEEPENGSSGFAYCERTRRGELKV